MIYNLFRTPIFYGDIDSKKIQFEQQNNFIPSWLSRAHSTKSKNNNNILKPESKVYLLKTIGSLGALEFVSFA